MPGGSKSHLKSRERTPSIFFLLISIFICQQSFVIGVGSLSQPGPGILALGSGMAMGGMAIWFLIRSFISKEGRDEDVQPGRALSRVRFLLLCITLFAYTVAIKRLGFLICTFLFVAFLLRLIGSKKWWRTLVEAVLITIGNYLLFVTWLGLDLPKGFLAW